MKTLKTMALASTLVIASAGMAYAGPTDLGSLGDFECTEYPVGQPVADPSQLPGEELAALQERNPGAELEVLSCAPDSLQFTLILPPSSSHHGDATAPKMENLIFNLTPAGKLTPLQPPTEEDPQR